MLIDSQFLFYLMYAK